MSDLFTIAHVSQLHKIERARLIRGQPGIGPEVEQLIRRLTSGGVAGKSDDIRVTQTKRLWDLGVSRGIVESEFDFSAYLATIPQIPTELLKDDPEFPLLVLVEPRKGLKRLCRLSDVKFSGEDIDFVFIDERHREFFQPTWIRVQGGRKNHGTTAKSCWESFGEREVGLTALQGMCAYIQHPWILRDIMSGNGHAMTLPGSVRRNDRNDRENVTSILLKEGVCQLQWVPFEIRIGDYGSASRRVSKSA